MRFGRVAPSGSQRCDKFFSDRRSVRLSTGLLHDFAHEATYGGIFPCSKVFGCLWMGRHRRRHPGIHSAFVSDLEQAFAFAISAASVSSWQSRPKMVSTAFDPMSPEAAALPKQRLAGGDAQFRHRGALFIGHLGGGVQQQFRRGVGCFG